LPDPEESFCHTGVTATGRIDVATIRKRANRWQAQVRLQGCTPTTKTFVRKSDAEAWARQQEIAIERGEILSARRSLKSFVLADVLTRYEKEVTPKRGAASEFSRLRTITSSLGSIPLDKLTPSTLARYRDERLLIVSSASVRRELVVLRHCLEVARREWDVPMPRNPMDQVGRPADSKGRCRRLSREDWEKLLLGLKKTRNKLLGDVVQVAIATGMRRGELLELRWSNVDFKNHTAYLPHTKNGDSRRIPLSPDALQVLLRVRRTNGEDRVFPITPNAVRLAWERLKERAGVEDLRFHDLRHEAISRFFEHGLSIPEVSAISGHKDTRMLLRYTHLKAENLAVKLRGMRVAANGADDSTGEGA
jgi:integrase